MSRMPKERMEKALEQIKVISEEDYTKVKALAAIVRPLRSVLHKTPDDYGMTGWRNIYFQSDGHSPGRLVHPRQRRRERQARHFQSRSPDVPRRFSGAPRRALEHVRRRRDRFRDPAEASERRGIQRPRLRHQEPRHQRRRERRHLRYRMVGVARLRRRQEVRRQPPCAQQDDRRAL
jgi:hypothetical protein